MINLDHKRIEEIINDAFGFSIAAIWDSIRGFLKEDSLDILSKEGVIFRQKVFIEIVKKLLEEHLVKFYDSRSGNVIQLPILEQLHLISDNWPLYESKDDSDDLDCLGGFWFFDKCPVGIIWICKDGSEIWT